MLSSHHTLTIAINCWSVLPRKILRDWKGFSIVLLNLFSQSMANTFMVHLCLQSFIGYPWTSASNSNFYCTNVSMKLHRLTLLIYWHFTNLAVRAFVHLQTPLVSVFQNPGLAMVETVFLVQLQQYGINFHAVSGLLHLLLHSSHSWRLISSQNDSCVFWFCFCWTLCVLYYVAFVRHFDHFWKGTIKMHIYYYYWISKSWTKMKEPCKVLTSLDQEYTNDCL